MFVPGRVIHGNLVFSEGPEKAWFEDFYDEKLKQGVVYPGQKDTGTLPWSEAWGRDPQASSRWPGLCVCGPIGVNPKRKHDPVFMDTGVAVEVRCYVDWVAVKGRDLGGPVPSCWLKMAIRTWNVTSLILTGKEPELVQEDERYQLDIVGLYSTSSSGSRTSLLEKGRTLYYAGVVSGERRRAGICQFSSSAGLSIAVRQIIRMCSVSVTLRNRNVRGQ